MGLLGFSFRYVSCKIQPKQLSLASFIESYGWQEMVDVDTEFETLLIQSWEALGWSMASWNGIEDAPESELKSWDALVAEEQEGASYLCYNENIWNEQISINVFGASAEDEEEEDEMVDDDECSNIFCEIFLVFFRIIFFFLPSGSAPLL